MKKPRGLYKKNVVWEPQNQEKRFPEGKFFCIDPHHMFFSWISWEKRHFWYLGEEKICIDPAGVYRLCPARLAQGGTRGKEPRTSISGIVCKPHATCCHVMAELLRLDCNSTAFRDAPSESGFYRYLRLTLSPFLYYGAFLTVSPIFAPLFLSAGFFLLFLHFRHALFGLRGVNKNSKIPH